VNGDKTVRDRPHLEAEREVTWIANDMFGKETAGSNDTRNLFDTTLTYAPGKLSLMANFDYGTEGDTSWWGSPATPSTRRSPTGRWSAATSTRTTRTAAS
jgi:hypothetical protein